MGADGVIQKGLCQSADWVCGCGGDSMNSWICGIEADVQLGCASIATPLTLQDENTKRMPFTDRTLLI